MRASYRLRSLGKIDQKLIFDQYLTVFDTVQGMYVATHRVSKNCANFFLSEFRQISTNFGNFWQKDSKQAKIMRGALILHLT